MCQAPMASAPTHHFLFSHLFLLRAKEDVVFDLEGQIAADQHRSRVPAAAVVVGRLLVAPAGQDPAFHHRCSGVGCFEYQKSDQAIALR